MLGFYRKYDEWIIYSTNVLIIPLIKNDIYQFVRWLCVKLSLNQSLKKEPNKRV